MNQQSTKQAYEQEKHRKQAKKQVVAFRRQRQNKKLAWQEKE